MRARPCTVTTRFGGGHGGQHDHGCAEHARPAGTEDAPVQLSRSLPAFLDALVENAAGGWRRRGPSTLKDAPVLGFFPAGFPPDAPRGRRYSRGGGCARRHATATLRRAHAHPRSAIPDPARRPPVSRRVGAVRIARGRRGSRPGDVRAGALAAARAARRRRAVLPDARAAQHVPDEPAHRLAPAGRRRRRSRTSSRPTRGRRTGRSRRTRCRRSTRRSPQLPDNFRLALVAVDVLGLSYREAARALRVREATLTTRLFRARKQVAERLAPAGVGAEERPQIAEMRREDKDASWSPIE